MKRCSVKSFSRPRKQQQRVLTLPVVHWFRSAERRAEVRARFAIRRTGAWGQGETMKSAQVWSLPTRTVVTVDFG